MALYGFVFWYFGGLVCPWILGHLVLHENKQVQLQEIKSKPQLLLRACFEISI